LEESTEWRLQVTPDFSAKKERKYKMKDEKDLTDEEEFKDLTPGNLSELSNEKTIKLLGILATSYGEDAKECEQVVSTSHGRTPHSQSTRDTALILQQIKAGQCVICATLAKIITNQMAISEGQVI